MVEKTKNRTRTCLFFLWCCIMSAMLWTTSAQAQLAIKYPLTISSGTYSSISGSGAPVAIIGDDMAVNITGLTGFTVNGTTYTNARMCSNGWLALYGASVPTTTGTYAPLSTAITNGAVIFAPFGRDLNSQSGTGAYWQTIGNELIFEWVNYIRYAQTGESLNFQIRLNTVTGEIKFVYGTMTALTGSTYPQVGWKTNGTVASNWATDVNNLMIDNVGSPNTCNWSNAVTGNANTSTMYFNSANATIKPNSGLTYTWTKPVATDPEPVRTHAAVSGITTNNATLNWTAPANATQYNVQYRTVGSCSWTNWSGNPVGTNSVTLTGLTSSTTYQVRVQASNGSTNAIYSHIPNLAGTGNGYVAAGTFTTVASCVAPTAPVGSPTTATTANISWTAASPVPSNGYEYAVTTSAVPPVSGTAFAGTSTSVSGLTPATTYYLHVRSYCGGSDYSAWVTSASFNTPCNAIATLPWTEGFESAVIPAYPSTCWYEDPSSGDWITTNNSSSSNDADARTGAQFLRDAYSATNEFIWTPGFSLTAGQSVDFSFWWAGDNYSGWTGDVFYNTAQTGTGATQMGTSFVTSGTTTTKTYAKQTRTLVAPATGTYYFAIRVNATGGPWYLSFDDFNVENTPSCVAPTALVGTPTTATTANISWTAASPVPSNGYEYAVTTSATPPGSGTAFAGTSTSVSGLTPSTTYYLHVRSYCGGSSYSTWASSASFMTGQIPATLPYSNSFGSNDFAFVNGSQTNQWAYGSATGNPANAIYVSNDNGTSNAYTISSLSVVQAFRDIAIPNGTTLTNFSFNWIANGESCCDYLRVWLVPTSYNPTAGTQITAGAGRIQIGSNMNVQSAWQTYTNNTLDLSSFAGQTMRLVFEWKNDGSIGTQPPAAIDNISLAQVASCSGTPAPGNTQSNLPSACSAQSFTLSMSNTINDIGITYDWQSSPDGITWTSTGGTNATYTTTQTASTYYQCVVNCTNSGMSATSTPVQVTMSPFYNCYCTTNLHTSSSPCITQVDFNTISNNTAGAGCALPAYSYQAATTTVLKGSSYTFTRTTTSTGVWTGVWIDYDQSGTFDASEYTEVSSTSTGALTNSVTITIPVTALDGNTGMRIRQRTVDMLATDACTQGFGSGETEDYTVDIQTPVGCSGTPSATIGGAPANVCAGVPFTLTAGPTGLAGFTYQFQNSTDGGLTWNNMGIADVFNNYIVSNQTVTTMYQVIVTCTNSGLSNTSTAVTVTQNSPTACYCTPTTVNGFTYYITNFTTTGGITNINNSSVGGGPYQNFSGSASASANPGATINYSISVTSGTYGRAIWIDLNEDGVFQATEQLVTSSSFLSSPLTGSFIIPNGTTAGTKRMRVLASWSYSGPTDPCNISGNGEYEDYSFEVVALPSCTGTPAATISGPANICAGIGFNLTAGPTGVDGLTYQFQNSTDGGITWNNLGSAGINNIYAITSQSVTTQYQVIVYCSYSGLNATSTPITVTQNLPSACYCTPTTGGGLTYYISNFTTTGGTTNINQSSGGSSTGYDDHSATVSGEFEPGSTINFTMTIAGSSNFGHAIWIDFNADGTFQATEQIVTSNSYLYSPITGSFTIPLNATTGVRRMRILTSFTPSNPTNPCTNSGQGEYEDYSINITPPVCISAPSSPANAGSACADVITNTVLLSWPSLSGATGYDVYFDANNPPTTLVSANQGGLSFSADVSGGAPVYYWMVVPQILGGGSSCTVWSFSLSPSPTPIASSGGDVCLGNDISLTGDNIAMGQSSGNTYSWTGPNGFNSTLQNPTIINPGVLYSGTYTVVVTNQYGCSASESTSLSVNDNPTLSIDSLKNVGCIGGSDGIIYVSASGGLSPYSFTSDFINFNVDGIMNNLPTGMSTIYVADGNACQAQISGSLTYTSTAPPAQSVNVPILGMPAYACNGTTATISVAAVANATQYTWDGPVGTTFNGNPSPYISTTPSVTVVFGAPNGSGYRIGVQAGNGCGSSLRKSQWLRGIVSTPAAVSGATTTCANSSGTYSTVAVDGATSYLWTVSGDATVSGNGTSVTVNFGPSWTGGTLCVSAQTPCFNSPSKCLVIGSSASPLNVISGSFTACPNQTLTFSVPASTGAASYNWTLPAGATGSSTTNSINATFSPSYNSVGNICVSVTSICGVTSPIKCKTVAPGLPSVPPAITGITNGVCGQSVSYSVAPVSGITYNWTAPGTVIGNGNSTVSVQYGSLTTGQVCVTASNSCGTSASRCVSVKGTPNSPIALTAVPSSWCANTQGIEFTADMSNTTGSYTISWTYPSAPTASYVAGGGNSNALTLDWGTGNGSVVVTATNSCGAGSKAFAVTIGCKEGEMASASKLNVYPNPTAGVLNVEYTADKGTAQVTVLDLSGRVVMTQSHANAAGQNILQLDLSKVAKGAYMLNVQTEGSNNQVRVVVE